MLRHLFPVTPENSFWFYFNRAEGRQKNQVKVFYIPDGLSLDVTANIRACQQMGAA